MSTTTMDYSLLFKGGDNVDDVYHDNGEDDGNDVNDLNSNQITSTAITTRDIDSLMEVGDQSTWVCNQIEALGFKYANTELSPELIPIFTSLFRERDHWQLQSHNLAYSCSSLKTKIDLLERNKEIDANRILVLTQDLHTTNEKMSALKAEQRDLKCLWLGEKGELESRCFQLQALQTQIQGTLRKKEKDYERLQAQFTKITKDTQKPQKGQASTTPSLTISQPLQRPSSQTSTKPGTLLDAEITSAKTTIATLELENQNLRSAIEDLTITFEECQARMTRELFEKSQSIAALESNTTSSTSMQTCLEQAKYVESRLDATVALLTTVHSTNTMTEASDSNSTNIGKYSSPMRGYQKSTLLGTPTARPLNWIVKQANTEVKLLRKRAEDLQWYIPPAKDVDEREGDDDDDEDITKILIENKENTHQQNNSNNTNKESSLQLNDLTKRYQTKLLKLKTQLEEAVYVICEQDRLIHAALVGNMSSYTTEKSTSNPGLNYTEEEENDNEEGESYDDEDVQFEGTVDLTTPMKRNQMNSSYDPSDWSAGFSELLPAVSPDTLAVLKAANFTTLPKQITDEDGNIEPRTLSSTLEELSEH